MPGRTFSRHFKLEVVRQIASGTKRPAQLYRQYASAESVLQPWRNEYELRGEAAFTAREPSQVIARERKIAERERFCGELALENAVRKKAWQTIPTRTDLL